MAHAPSARAEGAVGPMPLVNVRAPTEGGAHTSPQAIRLATSETRPLQGQHALVNAVCLSARPRETDLASRILFGEVVSPSPGGLTGLIAVFARSYGARKREMADFSGHRSPVQYSSRWHSTSAVSGCALGQYNDSGADQSAVHLAIVCSPRLPVGRTGVPVAMEQKTSIRCKVLSSRIIYARRACSMP
jgi:hypothetical protein